MTEEMKAIHMCRARLKEVTSDLFLLLVVNKVPEGHKKIQHNQRSHHFWVTYKGISIDSYGVLHTHEKIAALQNRYLG